MRRVQALDRVAGDPADIGAALCIGDCDAGARILDLIVTKRGALGAELGVALASDLSEKGMNEIPQLEAPDQTPLVQHR